MTSWRGWLGRGLLWLALWQTGLRLWRKFGGGPRPAWLEREPSRALRDRLWPPETIVSRLELQPGMRVVEIEAGAGGLTAALARAVGPTGAVVATDHRPALTEALRIDTLEQGLSQVTVQTLPVGALPPEASGCEAMVLTATFNSLADKQAFVVEVHRALRPGGILAVSELVVDVDYSLASTVVTHLVLAGFNIERESGGFAGFTVIGRKSA